MRSFAVTKSPPVMVRPSTSSTEQTTPTPKMTQLSSWDRSYVGFPVTSLLVYDGPIHHPVEAIKKGLSQALVHYYPVAGRLQYDGGGEGELHLSCTGELGLGVPFVAASADCTLEDQRLLDATFATDLLDDLAVYYPADGCRRTDPLLLIQVTEFACGGFVVAVTWNHALADGDGMAQFLQAVGELTRTRGLAPAPAPSVVPVRASCEVTLPELSPWMVAAKQWLMLTRGGLDMTYLDITIPSKVINRVKYEFKAAHHSGDGQYCTTFEAAIAVLWQCRTRAIGSDADTPAPLAFFVNVRKHLGAKAGYYGNCAVAQVASATSGEVADGHINDVVKLIKGAKEKVAEVLREGGVRSVRGAAEEELTGTFGYNAFMVSSWRNIGFDAADFGGGPPARVASRWQQSTIPGCVAFVPRRRGDGGGGENMLTQCVREEHVDAFLAEIANLSSSSH